jgi:hypothetical protein
VHASITAIHYLAGGVQTGILHGLLRNLYIIPIIYGAYWFGVQVRRVSRNFGANAYLLNGEVRTEITEA